MTLANKKEIVRKIHQQSKELTKRMWKNLKPYINSEIKLLKKINPKKYENFSRKDWSNYIRRKLGPEWCALIDKKYNLVSPRYGFTGEDVLFPKPVRCVSPKPYSIGDVHYHPVYKKYPSVDDLMSWTNRYLFGERIFCIHTDYSTICYFFSDKIKKEEIPKELFSIGLALFGCPRSIRKKIHEWFEYMLNKKRIKVIEIKGGEKWQE